MYQLFDFKGNEVKHHDLQDKSVWCKEGATIEETFVEKFGSELNVKINPDKTQNPYVPDIIRVNDNNLGDLKTQNTPFFKAQTLFQIHPTYAIVFNFKDFRRYSDKYPNIVIYFWVNWMVRKFKMNNTEIIVDKISGVWMIEFDDIIELVKTAPKHFYQQRRDDTKGNAKGSYVFDIRDKYFKKVI